MRYLLITLLAITALTTLAEQWVNIETGKGPHEALKSVDIKGKHYTPATDKLRYAVGERKWNKADKGQPDAGNKELSGKYIEHPEKPDHAAWVVLSQTNAAEYAANIEAAKTAAALAEYSDDLATLGELLTDSGLDINDYETVKEVTEALHAKGLALRDAVAKAADYKAMQSAQVAYNAQLGRNSLLQIMFSQMSADASELVKLVKAAAVKETP